MDAPVCLRWQYARDGHDITSQAIYAEEDADTARVWNHDFCVMEAQRDADDSGRWRITNSDGYLPDDAEEQRFDSPAAALDYHATQNGLTYQITTDDL